MTKVAVHILLKLKQKLYYNMHKKPTLNTLISINIVVKRNSWNRMMFKE